MDLPPDVRKVIEENQKYGMVDFVRMVIPEVVARLKRLLASTVARQAAEDAELKRFIENYKPDPVAESHGYDPIPGEVMLNEQTEKVMFANVAVAIDAEKENFLIYVCKELGLGGTKKEDHLTFDAAIRVLVRATKIDLRKLPGAKGHERARLLANCFKHNAWKVSEEAFKELGGKVDDDIAYEKEDWAQMIDDTGLVLDEIVSWLK